MTWLINQYLKKQFRLEDKPRIRNVLEQFIHVKNKLEEKDINRYTFRQLESTMDTIFNITLDNNNTDDTANSDEVKVLYDGPLGKLAIPLTQEASCILGRGTKWCTAAKEDNAFNTYNEDGPLYIWRDKSGEKYQFHFKTMQFMNDKDHPISNEQLNYFRTNNAVTKKCLNVEKKK